MSKRTFFRTVAVKILMHSNTTTSLIVLLTILLSACSPPTVPPTPPTPDAIAPTETAIPSPTSSHTPPPTLTATTIPEPTSTPITQPPPLLQPPSEANTLGIVYKQDEFAWLWLNGLVTPLDWTQSEAACSLQVKISSDGETVAYVHNNTLKAIDSDGRRRRDLLSQVRLQAISPAETDQPVSIMHVKWIPGTHNLLFNTVKLPIGSNYVPQDDLHLIDADTRTYKLLLPPGEGGDFFPSPDGKKIAVSSLDKVSLMNADGSRLRTVLEYPVINTYSEYGHYPVLTWAADSQSLLVAIPPEDPFTNSEAPTTIWRIPTDGSSADPIITIFQGTGVHPVYFSSDLLWMAYLSDLASYPETELHIAKIDNSVDEVYTTGQVSFIGWLPDSAYFLYNWNLLGAPGLEPSNLSMMGSVVNRWTGLLLYTWLDPSYSLVTLNAPWKTNIDLIDASPRLEASLDNPDEVCDYIVVPVANIPTPTASPTGGTPTPTDTPTPTETQTLEPTLPITGTPELTATLQFTQTPTPDLGHLILSEHTSPVNGVTFSPDGRIIASASSDTTINLWDATNGELLQTLREHIGSVTSVTFSPNGQLLISSGGRGDQSIRLWDVATRRMILALFGHSGPVYALAIHPDGELFASAGEEMNIFLWDVASGQIVGTITEQTAPVRSLAFSSSGNILVSGSSDGIVRVWDVPNSEERFVFEIRDVEVYSLAISPDRRSVAAGYSDGFIRLWDLLTGELMQELGEGQGAINAVAFSPDGNLLASGGSDALLRLYTTADWQVVGSLSGHTASILGLAFSPDGETLASGGSDNTVRLWEITIP